MASVDTTALRRFLDPVMEARAAQASARKTVLAKQEKSIKEQEKAGAAYAKACEAYQQSVGEMIGGIRQLVEDAER